MLDSNRGQVLTLIHQHPHHEDKFVVNQRTLTHLTQYQADFCFVSICGDYRSGKSFLLNSLFFNSWGFQTSSTTSSCTKGIKIWSEPIRYNDICIWIIDTEGFGSIEKDSSYDGKIFLMNFLISNIILYNSFGAIDQNSINKLAMICREARALDQSTIETKLFWILRDFSLQMTDKQGKTLSSDEYLEECLKESHQQNKSEKEFLRTLFKERHCFTLIRPVIDESKLGNLKQVSRIELREQFKSQISKLYDKVLQCAESKMINRIRIGSHNIGILINEFVSTVNDGRVDCDLNCTYDKIMRHEHSMKKEAILTTLGAKIESLRKMLPVQKHHINYLTAQTADNVSQALQQFESISTGAQLQLLKIQTNLEVSQAIASLQRQNRSRLQQQIKEYLHRQLIQLYPKLIALNHQGFQLKFLQIFTQLRDQYLTKYTAYQMDQQFLPQCYNQFIERQEKKVFCQMVKRWRSGSKDIQQKYEQLKKSKKSLEEEVKKVKEEKAKASRALQESKKEQSKALQRMKADIEQTFKEQAGLIVSNYQAKIKSITSQHDQQVIQLKVTITTLEQRLSHLSTQSQYEKQSLLQKISLERERAELACIKWEQAKNSLEMQHQQRKNSLQNRVRIAEMRYGELQSTLASERKKYQIISEERRIEENNLLQELGDKNYKIESLTEELIHLEDRYKQELERILIEEKDIVCKSVTSKINEYEYKCRLYQAKLQEYAIVASEKEFYEQRSEELDIENRQLKALLEEEQDRSAVLGSHASKHEKELEEKEKAICSMREQHSKEMALMNENLLNNQHFLKESEQRHAQEIEWYRSKLENSLKDQSSDLTHRYEESLGSIKAGMELRFQKERQQLKEIIKNNYDEVENLKITIVTLSSEVEKIFEILTRVVSDYQQFHKVQGESRKTSLRNSYLSDIAESPEEEYSEKLPSASKQLKVFKSTEFIAEEIEEIFISLKEQIVLLTKERMSLREELKSCSDQLDSFERGMGKVKQQSKGYRSQLQELKRRVAPLELSARELQTVKQKCESLQKENAQVRREIELKEQLFASKDENFRQNTIMYKEAIANLTEQTKLLSSKLKHLTDVKEDCQAELQRFKIWASEVKNKSPYPVEEVEMSAQKMKDLQNEIKRLAKKLQESKMEKLQKGTKKQVNIYSAILHDNRVSEIEALRAENEQLYRQLQQKQELEVKSLEERKSSKQRQLEHEEQRLTALKEEYDAYKKKSKQAISLLQSKIDTFREENKQLKQDYRQLEGSIVHKYEFAKKVMEQEAEELKREKQSLTQFYNKKVHGLQEALNSRSYEADKRIAQSEVRFQQYRGELQKEQNRIILEGERHRLKYEHLLKVNGELIKQIESLKSKAHQMTIKEKYKSKISSLFDD